MLRSPVAFSAGQHATVADAHELHRRIESLTHPHALSPARRRIGADQLVAETVSEPKRCLVPFLRERAVSSRWFCGVVFVLAVVVGDGGQAVAFVVRGDGGRLIETGNGWDEPVVRKQLVWGLTYIDELIEVSTNGTVATSPTGLIGGNGGEPSVNECIDESVDRLTS